MMVHSQVMAGGGRIRGCRSGIFLNLSSPILASRTVPCSHSWFAFQSSMGAPTSAMGWRGERLLSPNYIRISKTSFQENKSTRAYQHSIKYLKLLLHWIPCSGSSLSLGIDCLTIYVRRSIKPALGCISVPSAGNGKRC